MRSSARRIARCARSRRGRADGPRRSSTRRERARYADWCDHARRCARSNLFPVLHRQVAFGCWLLGPRGSRTPRAKSQQPRGLAKGNLVKEIDALGGLMGEASDRAGIQFKVLNRSKGPAVQGPRAQCDRDLYASAVQALLHGVTVIEASVSSLFDRGVILGDGTKLHGRAIIITTGTFLR